jgi:hypothetical protein
MKLSKQSIDNLIYLAVSFGCSLIAGYLALIGF